MRADLDELVARYGGSASLIDRQERCRMVACDGATFYLAAQRYGGTWRVLLDDAALRQGLTICPPAHPALGPAAPSADIPGVLGPGRPRYLTTAGIVPPPGRNPP